MFTTIRSNAAGSSAFAYIDRPRNCNPRRSARPEANPSTSSHVLKNAPPSRSSVLARAYKQEFEAPTNGQRSLSLASTEVAVDTCEPPSISLWQRYCMSLESNPFATKAATSFLGFMIGDCLAQSLEGAAAIDAARVVRLGSYGLLLDGPVGHMWYRWLDGTCDKTFENPKGAAAVSIKTAADQLIWAPVMTAVFFAFLKLMEGEPNMILATVQDKTLATVAANYVIWPAAHVISFKYVPSEQRVLYNNGIAIFWNCYLSLVAAGTIPSFFSLFEESSTKSAAAGDSIGSVVAGGGAAGGMLGGALSADQWFSGTQHAQSSSGEWFNAGEFVHNWMRALQNVQNFDDLAKLRWGCEDAVAREVCEKAGGLSAVAAEVKGSLHESLPFGNLWLHTVIEAGKESLHAVANNNHVAAAASDALSHLHHFHP